MRGGGGLFHQCGVLLRHLVELAHGLVDLADAARLVGCGCRDLSDDAAHALHAAHDFVHGAACVLHQAGACFNFFHRGMDQLLDLACGFGRAARQAAHLARHHGEAPALLAGACGFHGSVQRQDVGLEGDAIDHANDVGDLARALVDVAHGADHLAHHLTAPRRHLCGGGGELVCLVRRVGGLAHRGGEVVHALRRLPQAAGRGLGAGRQVLVAAGDLGAGGADAVHRGAHLLQHLHVAQSHAFDLAHQRTDLVLPRGLEALRQVALRHQGDGLREAGERLADAAAQHHEQAHAQQAQGECHQPPDGPGDVALAGHGLGVGYLGHHPPAALGFAQQCPGRLSAGIEHGGRVAHKAVRRGRQRLEEGARLREGLKHLFAARRGVVHKARLLQRGSGVDQVHAAVLEEAHLLHLLLQHGIEDADVVADEQQRHHLAAGIFDWQVIAHVGLASHQGGAGVGLAFGYRGICRVGALQRRALLALALFVLHRGGDADEILALAGEHAGHAAGFVGELVHRAVVLVHQGPIAAQLARFLVELHGGLEVALEAAHGAFRQLAVGVVGGVERMRQGLGRVAHTAHQLRACTALGER